MKCIHKNVYLVFGRYFHYHTIDLYAPSEAIINEAEAFFEECKKLFPKISKGEVLEAFGARVISRFIEIQKGKTSLEEALKTFSLFLNSKTIAPFSWIVQQETLLLVQEQEIHYQLPENIDRTLLDLISK